MKQRVREYLSIYQICQQTVAPISSTHHHPLHQGQISNFHCLIVYQAFPMKCHWISEVEMDHNPLFLDQKDLYGQKDRSNKMKQILS